MTTMKQVAKEAGVSVSTVSIIVNNQQKERHIPEETVQKVNQAIQDLNYKPNRIARQLRKRNSLQKQIALCFPMDPDTGIMNVIPGLLSHLQAKINSKNYAWTLIIQSFQNDQIKSLINDLKNMEYDAAVVVAGSKKDIRFLEKANLSIPVILVNRESKILSTVGVDSNLVAQTAITLFQAKRINEINIVKDTNNYQASNKRLETIIDKAKNVGIKIANQYSAQYSCESGAKVAKQIAKRQDFKPILVESDLTAIGMIYQFNRLNIDIPNQMPLLSLSVLETRMTAFQTPSISTISVPTKELAKNIIEVISIFDKTKQSQHILLTPDLHLRDTF